MWDKLAHVNEWPTTADEIIDLWQPMLDNGQVAAQLLEAAEEGNYERVKELFSDYNSGENLVRYN
jgi:hypothetical protein